MFGLDKLSSNADCYSSQEDTSRVEQLSEALGSTHILRVFFNPILNVVLQALDAPPVFMRTKALKALGQIVTSDPSILATVRWFGQCVGCSSDLFLIDRQMFDEP